jgi:tetratricopeptide (TPR) repeat protein
VRPYQVRLVFLNACQSAEWTALEAARSFATQLLRIGVPALIGMQLTVLDSVAVEFSRHFYEALADSRRVDEAVRDARQLVAASRSRRTADMGIPVCYLRPHTGVILELPPAPVGLTIATWRPWLRRQMTPRKILAGLLGLITVAATLLGLYTDVLPFLRGPPPMTGDFNVAVAEFAAMDEFGEGGDAAEAVALSDQVFRRLDDELAAQFSTEGFDIAVRAPEDTGPIQGETRDERAAQAAVLASEIGADVILYGTLRSTDSGHEFQPEFYLTDRTLQGAEELVGQYELGEAEPADPANPVVSRQLRETVLTRTQALAQFVIGLGYYAIGEYDEARVRFLTAEATPEWEDDDGKEILYLLLGNVSARLREYQTAGEYYQRALTINPDYARAHVGRADTVFQASRGSCTPGTADVGGLENAAARFDEALQAAFRPALSDIRPKVAFGLGRVHLCQMLAGLPEQPDAADFQEVVDDFEAVVEEYEAGNDRLDELATESHASLGLVYASFAAGPEELRRAVDEYLVAIEMSTDNERKAEFHGLLGFINEELGEKEAARVAYEQAIELTADEEKQDRFKGELASLDGTEP